MALSDRAAESSRPVDLGIAISGERYRLKVNQRGARLESSSLGKNYLALDRSELTKLLLGHFDVKDAAAAGRIEVSTAVALTWAQAIFPRLPIWYPPLDDFPAK